MNGKKHRNYKANSNVNPRAFSPRGASEYSGLPIGTINRFIEIGTLPHRRTEPLPSDHFVSGKPGRRPGVRIVEKKDLDELIDSLPKYGMNVVGS